MESLSEALDHIFRSNEHLSIQERDRLAFRLLKEKGYSPGEILHAIRSRTMVLPKTHEVKPPQFDSIYEGCQRNEDGLVIDPYLLEPIPKEHLISYTRNQQKFCFDRRTLYKEFILQEKYINPFNREQLPKGLVAEVLNYGHALRKFLHFNGINVIIESFHSFGDVIVTLLRSLPGSILDNLAMYNPTFQEESLYNMNLAEEHTLPNNSVIHSYPFLNLIEKSTLLLQFFQFIKTKRSSGLHNSLYTYLGSLLQLSPIVKTDEGHEFTINPTLTVIEVVKEFYRALGGLQHIQNINLIFANGESLAFLNLTGTIVSQIPNELIYHVPYNEDRNEIISHYKSYAFYYNDRSLLNAIFHGTNAEGFQFRLEGNDSAVTRGNYTFDELEGYLVALVAQKEMQYHFDKRLAVKIRNLQVSYFRRLCYAVLQQAILSGETQNFFEAQIIITSEGLSHELLKRFDLGVMTAAVRSRIVEIIAPGTTKQVNRFFQDRTLDFTDHKVALLDSVEIFLAYIRNERKKDDIVTYCIITSVERQGQKIITYAAQNYDPILSFPGVLRIGTDRQFQTLLQRLSGSELNTLTRHLHLDNIIAVNNQNEKNLQTLLSDERLTAETLSYSQFWTSPLFRRHPEVWLNLRNFTNWLPLFQAVITDPQVARKDLVLLVQKLSSEDLQELEGDVRMYDLLLEANSNVKIPSGLLETFLLNAANQKLPFVVNKIYTTVGVNTEWLLKKVLQEQNKEVRRILSQYPLKNNDIFSKVLKSAFLEQWEFQSLPLAYFADYLFMIASEDEFRRITQNANLQELYDFAANLEDVEVRRRLSSLK